MSNSVANFTTKLQEPKSTLEVNLPNIPKVKAAKATQFLFNRELEANNEQNQVEEDNQFESKLFWFIPDSYHLIVKRALNIKYFTDNWSSLSDILKLDLIIEELKQLDVIYPESYEVTYVLRQAIEYINNTVLSGISNC